MAKHTNIKAFLLYNAAAVSAAALDFLLFFGLIHLGAHYTLSQGIARIGGGSLSFCMNKKFSFDAHPGRTHIEIRRFLLLYAFSYSLALLCLPTYYRLLGLPLFYAKLLTDGTCFIINFITMKFYVYAPVEGLTEKGRRALFPEKP